MVTMIGVPLVVLAPTREEEDMVMMMAEVAARTLLLLLLLRPRVHQLVHTTTNQKMPGRMKALAPLDEVEEAVVDGNDSHKKRRHRNKASRRLLLPPLHRSHRHLHRRLLQPEPPRLVRIRQQAPLVLVAANPLCHLTDVGHPRLLL